MWAKLKELYEPHDGTTKLHTLGALFNMCVLQEEEDVSNFLATWEEAMDHAITVGNLIPKDIKIGLILNKHPKSCGTFITMSNNIKSLSELPTKIHHEDKRKWQINQWPWLLHSIDMITISTSKSTKT